MQNGTTKQRILERAYQLGGLYGLESLTIGQLAEQLEMSKAGVYGHFGSKQALQLETIRYARASRSPRSTPTGPRSSPSTPVRQARFRAAR